MIILNSFNNTLMVVVVVVVFATGYEDAISFNTQDFGTLLSALWLVVAQLPL